MLLGKYPLASVWLYCSDLTVSTRFYRDTLGLTVFDKHGDTTQLDAGGVRLSLHPDELGTPNKPGNLPARGSFYVFLVQDSIGEVYDELVKRGVQFYGPPEDFFYGRVASFCDPDNHQLFIWQPPAEADARFGAVAPLVMHHQAIYSRLLGQDDNGPDPASP